MDFVLDDKQRRMIACDAAAARNPKSERKLETFLPDPPKKF